MNIINILRKKVVEKPNVKLHTLNTFINPYSYLVLRKNQEILKEFDRIFIDGIILVKFLRLFKVKSTKRFSFDMTSGAIQVYNYAINNSLSVFIIGAKQDEIDNAIPKIKELFPKLNILGYRNGYFSDNNERSITIGKIKKINPDIVIVGMGTPLQEKFLIELRNSGWNGTGFTCGGYIHQTQMRKYYFPEWSNRLNIRWLYRMYMEPQVIFRHLRNLPLFPPIFIFDWIKSFKTNK